MVNGLSAHQPDPKHEGVGEFDANGPTLATVHPLGDMGEEEEVNCLGTMVDWTMPCI